MMALLIDVPKILFSVDSLNSLVYNSYVDSHFERGER